MSVRTAVLVLLLLATVGLCAFAFAQSRGEELSIVQLLGLVLPLSLLGVFAGLYRREAQRHPELTDEDDRSRLLGRVVLKLGCLVLVVASLSALVFGLLIG
jgi:peptidoglycan/LPS O-acetylase OafA/YrhL